MAFETDFDQKNPGTKKRTFFAASLSELCVSLFLPVTAMLLALPGVLVLGVHEVVPPAVQMVLAPIPHKGYVSIYLTCIIFLRYFYTVSASVV